MASFFLSLVGFDPNTPVPADGSFQAAIRKEENNFYCSSVDVPKDALIEVLHLTNYIFAEKINTAAVNLIKSADENAGNGYIYNVIVDDSITDIETAIQRNAAAEAVMAQVNYTLSFQTYVKGWKAGQTLTLIHLSRGIHVVLVIQDVKKRFFRNNVILSTINAATIRITKPSQAYDDLMNNLLNPTQPRLIRYEGEPEN